MINSLPRKRLVVFIVALISLHCGTDREKSPSEIILTKACDFLWQHQGNDGGWHSEMHGLLRSGQALTPYILFKLTEVPDSVYPKPKGKIEKALDFIRQHVNEQGILGLHDKDVIEYPVYSTAYALRVILRYGTKKDSVLIEKMKNYLINQQFVEHRGIRPNDLAYGSWGFGETNIAHGKVGHVDLSHTRHVLEALGEAEYRNADMLKKTTRFLRLVQKHPSHIMSPRGAYDGGFYFSPVVLDQNKAGKEKDSFRSYATATCGGLLALLASGHSRNDEPVQVAMKWLESNPALDYPPGIPANDPDQWRKVLFFYHLSVRAEAYRAMGYGGTWKEEIVRLLSQRQAADGSFSNPYGSPNKEDDPLLATALAIAAIH